MFREHSRATSSRTTICSQSSSVSRTQSLVAQFLAVCSASNLAEARCISSLLQGSSLAKTRAFSRPSRAHGHHLRPSTNCYKLSETNLPGYVGFFQFLRNFHQLTAFEQAEMILYAALDPAVAGKARKGDFVRCLD